MPFLRFLLSLDWMCLCGKRERERERERERGNVRKLYICRRFGFLGAVDFGRCAQAAFCVGSLLTHQFIKVRCWRKRMRGVALVVVLHFGKCLCSAGDVLL